MRFRLAHEMGIFTSPVSVVEVAELIEIEVLAAPEEALGLAELIGMTAVGGEIGVK